MAIGDKCEIDGCCSKGRVTFSKKYQMKLCDRHRGQLDQYGKIFTRTVFDKNEIVVHDGYAEVVLYNPNHEEIARAKIDTEDIDMVKDYKWKLSVQGYAASGENSILMHRLIMNCPKDMVVDHIDHDTLNNRKANMRVCTRSNNGSNQVVQKNNKTGVTGVHWDNKRELWIAQIMLDYKHIPLGSFVEFEDAVAARKSAEDKYFGEFAYKGCANS